MIRTLLLAASLILLPHLVFAEEESNDSRKFTSDRVFDLEYADTPRISPDGKTIIYARRSMDRFSDSVTSKLWSIEIKTGKHRPFLSEQKSVSSIRWSPKGDRLLYLSKKDGKPVLKIHYLDSGESFSLAQFEHSPSAPVWSPNGKYVAFSMLVTSAAPSFAKAPTPPEGAEWAEPAKVIDDLTFRFDGRGYLKKGNTHIFVISAEGGTPRQISNGDNSFSSPAWLSDDSILAVGNDVKHPELDPIESEIYKINLEDLSRELLISRDGPDNGPTVSPNGKKIAYLGYDDKLKAYQQTDVYVVEADGSDPTNLTEKHDRSISAIAWRPDGKALIAQTLADGEIELITISLSGKIESLVSGVGGTSLGRPYGSGNFSVASAVSGKTAVAFTHASPDRPAEVGYVTGGGKARILTDLNSDALDHLDMATIEEIKIKSRHDEREIEAWIALPHDFKADGSYPMIIEIHGGPFAMYGPYFAAEIQRYAAEGYVTVYANPRGSTGYGEEFAQLIDLAYPGNDHDDLMSVVDALVEKNYVDPKRLFITGGSGGGVLTAWAVGKTKRFAAAATIKPVINWTTMALSADISRFVSRHWLRAQPWEDPELYWRLSPLSLVGNVTTPTMVMVGEADWRTPAWEAEQFYTALKVQKVDTALVRIPGASHSIASKPSRLIAKVDNILGWFAKYDPENKDEESE